MRHNMNSRLLVFLILNIMVGNSYAQQKPLPSIDDYKYTPGSDRTANMQSKNENVGKVKTDELKEFQSIKKDHVNIAKSGQYDKNRMHALNYIGERCNASIYEQEYVPALLYVMKNDRVIINKALALSYYGLCSTSNDTDEKLFNVVKSLVDTFYYKKLDEPLGIKNALMSLVLKVAPDGTVTYMTNKDFYTVGNGAVKGLILSKRTGSITLLQKLNDYCIAKSNLIGGGENTYNADDEINKLKIDILNGLASKIKDYGYKNAITPYLQQQITETKTNLKYDATSKATVTFLLADLDCNKWQVYFKNQKGCSLNLTPEVQKIVVASLKDIVNHENWPPEIRGLAYDHLKEYVPEQQIMTSSGTTKTLMFGQEYKELIAFQKKQDMINSGTAYMMEFIIAWISMGAAAELYGERVIGIFVKIFKKTEKSVVEADAVLAAEKLAKEAKAVEAAAQEAKQNQQWLARVHSGEDQSVIAQRQLAKEAAQAAKNEVNLAGKGKVGLSATQQLNAAENTGKQVAVNASLNPINVPDLKKAHSFISDAASDPTKAKTTNEFFTKLKNEYKLTDTDFASKEFNSVMDKFDDAHNCATNAVDAEGHSLKAAKLKSARASLNDYLKTKTGRPILTSEVDDLYRPLMGDGVLGKPIGSDLEEIAEMSKKLAQQAKEAYPGDLDGQIKQLRSYTTYESNGSITSKAVENAIKDIQEYSKPLYANNPTLIVSEANSVIQKQASVSSRFKKSISVNKEYASDPETYANSLSKMMETDNMVKPSTFKDPELYIKDAILNNPSIDTQIQKLNEYKQMITDGSDAKRSLLNEISKEGNSKVFKGVDDYVSQVSSEITTNETKAVKAITDKIAELETKRPPDEVANKIISNITSERSYTAENKITKLKEAKHGQKPDVQELIDKQIVELEKSIQSRTFYQTNFRDAEKIRTEISGKISRNKDPYFQKIRVKPTEITAKTPETFAKMEEQHQIYIKYTSQEYTDQVRDSWWNISSSSSNNADKIKSLENILSEANKNYEAAKTAVKQVETLAGTDPAFASVSDADAIYKSYTTNKLRNIQSKQDALTKSITEKIQELKGSI